MDSLTATQIAAYHRDGYVIIPNLISPALITAAEHAIWIEEGVDPDNPATWPARKGKWGIVEAPQLAALFTPPLTAAAAQLAGENPATFPAPKGALPILNFPSAPAQEIPKPVPHIDHSIQADNHRTFPRPFRISVMVYLTNTPPHGGGTLMWPGSHKKIKSLAQQDPEKYALMHTLGLAVHTMDLGPPLETTPQAGEVLFFDTYCAHSGSANTSHQPRFVVNHKW